MFDPKKIPQPNFKDKIRRYFPFKLKGNLTLNIIKYFYHDFNVWLLDPKKTPAHF